MIWGRRGSSCFGAIQRTGSHSVNLRILARGVLVHVACALVTIGAFIIHVYMGTAMVRGGFTSIIRGEVSPAWARLHHRLWYERVAGK